MSVYFMATLLIKNPSLLRVPVTSGCLILGRCIVGFTSFLLLVGAIKYLSYSTSIVLYFLYPMFTSVGAWLFLAEKVTIFDFLAIIISMGGVVIYACPQILTTTDTD